MRFERGVLIGDPHLGKKFEIGVPPPRRGEREAWQLRDFIMALDEPGDMVVMVGDLFDNPYVSHAVVKAAVEATLFAARRRPKTTFVMMAGNHDVPRKIDATAAFNVFHAACDERFPNLRVLLRPAVLGGVAFFPWEWDRTALEQIEDLRHAENVTAAVGHWDLTSFGGEDRHIAPVAALLDAFGSIPIYSGHYHTPGSYPLPGGSVDCTGSLQPYGHAEDPQGLIYVTMTLEEALAAPEGSLHDKCVRVLLAPGEERPQLDALAVTAKRLETAPVEQVGGGSALDKFDWHGIVRAKLAPLDPEVRSFIQERLPSNESAEE